MCYSLQASISSFIINIVSTFVLLNIRKNPNIKALTLFFAFVGLMQLYDFIFWLTQKRFLHFNSVVTKLAMITNHLQPLVLYLLLSYFTQIKFNSVTKFVLFFYIVFATFYSVTNFNKLTQTKVYGTTLKWDWNYFKYSTMLYTLFLISLSLLALHIPYPLNVFMLFINIVSYIFSYQISKNSETGRVWCKISAYIPLILFFF
jgi:hypothetical protein